MLVIIHITFLKINEKLCKKCKLWCSLNAPQKNAIWITHIFSNIHVPAPFNKPDNRILLYCYTHHWTFKIYSTVQLTQTVSFDRQISGICNMWVTNNVHTTQTPALHIAPSSHTWCPIQLSLHTLVRSSQSWSNQVKANVYFITI
jgi:hypothetical protein